MNEFIEKLIGRLEERKNHFGTLVVVGKDDLVLNYNLGKMHSFEDSIEIVNQLAEEYNNDFCKWRLCDEEANVYDTTCRNPHILIEGSPTDNNYEYCPYCGKKIKIAPYQQNGE